MSAIEIVSVTAKRDWKAFVHFPYTHYKDYPNWVPHLIMDQKTLLNPKKHPFYKHAKVQLFLAKAENRVVGRIAAIVDNNHIETHQEQVGFFGFFETIDDEAVSFALLHAALNWLKAQGMEAMRGPVNPSMNEECGLLVDAFDEPPRLLMTYNPPYYADHIERFGLKKVMDLYAYHIDGHEPPPEKLVRVAERVKARNDLVMRQVDMKHYDREVQDIWKVYNQAWSRNWGFVPWTWEEFQHLGKDMKTALVPDMALIVEKEGEPIAFAVSLPDMNRALIKTNGRLFPLGLFKLLYHSKKIDWCRIVILGVVKDHQGLGIDAMLYLETWKNATRRGYYHGEMSWILENNEMMNRAACMLGGKVYKTYRMYQMDCT